MPKLRVRTKASAQSYDITIGRDVLSQTGRIALSALDQDARKVAIVSNAKVFSLYGQTVRESLQGSGLTVTHFVIGDGERHKSFPAAAKVLAFFSQSRLDRTDGVVALGGGVVGDLTGFAASIYLRGLSFVQIPTTLLAQIDASVGGKTAINIAGGKNIAGSFHQPRAVIVDITTLSTLPSREVVSGACEMVKQAAVSSSRLFTQTVAYLRSARRGSILISRDLEQLVQSHCAFKASIIRGDEREQATRTDHRSRRILNFGHTIGHALETVTGYRHFRHGEAVGYGVLAAGAISKNLGMLGESELELLTEAIRMCGPLPAAANLDHSAIIKAIRRDKKRVGGNNQWVLLERIGRARIVSEKEISPALIKTSLTEALTTSRA